MKLVSRILIVLFIAFLSTPTIVTLIEKNTDVSIFYNFSEEEIHKDLKVIKAFLKQNNNFSLFETKNILKSKIISKNMLPHNNVSEEIFSPPPELV